jgi:hypothetical protein
LISQANTALHHTLFFELHYHERQSKTVGILSPRRSAPEKLHDDDLYDRATYWISDLLALLPTLKTDSP